jgi:adenylosuccinate lyase
MDEILSKEKLEEIKKKIKSLNLDMIRVSKHLNRNKSSGIITEQPRHGMSWEDAKRFVKETDKITWGKITEGIGGKRYMVEYKLNHNKFCKLVFLLDENPPFIFNIMPSTKNNVKKFLRKYRGYYSY